MIRNFFLVSIFSLLCSIGCSSDPKIETLKLGAERTEAYLNILKGKKVGLLVNHTSMVGEQHLVDFPGHRCQFDAIAAKETDGGAGLSEPHFPVHIADYAQSGVGVVLDAEANDTHSAMSEVFSDDDGIPPPARNQTDRLSRLECSIVSHFDS